MGKGKVRVTKKFGAMKRTVAANDPRLKKDDPKKTVKEVTIAGDEIKHVEQASSAMYFRYNTQLGPPYHILVDTNFINFSIQNKLEMVKSMMDCLFAKCTPCITDCVFAELEKLGPRFRVAMRIAKDPRFKRLTCSHVGTYADDCLVNRIKESKCYIVATCDRDLKRRIRKVPGVPIMYSIERMPDAFGAPRL